MAVEISTRVSVLSAQGGKEFQGGAGVPVTISAVKGLSSDSVTMKSFLILSLRIDPSYDDEMYANPDVMIGFSDTQFQYPVRADGNSLVYAIQKTAMKQSVTEFDYADLVGAAAIVDLTKNGEYMNVIFQEIVTLPAHTAVVQQPQSPFAAFAQAQEVDDDVDAF